MYLIIQNLPRKDRYKRENMILVSVIPGPKEPSLHINSYLLPLVNDFLEFYSGVSLSSVSCHGISRAVIVRLALTCVACDLPAIRKVCGFVSYDALHGCSKCMKEFPTTVFGQSPDYSGYDRATWVNRDTSAHKVASYHYQRFESRNEH